MTGTNINPDSVILQQLEGRWQTIAMQLLWKFAKREKVKLTAADMAAMHAEFSPTLPTLYVHGHPDSIDFQIVDEAAGRHLAAHDASMQPKSVN